MKRVSGYVARQLHGCTNQNTAVTALSGVELKKNKKQCSTTNLGREEHSLCVASRHTFLGRHGAAPHPRVATRRDRVPTIEALQCFVRQARGNRFPPGVLESGEAAHNEPVLFDVARSMQCPALPRCTHDLRRRGVPRVGQRSQVALSLSKRVGGKWARQCTRRSVLHACHEANCLRRSLTQSAGGGGSPVARVTRTASRVSPPAAASCSRARRAPRRSRPCRPRTQPRRTPRAPWSLACRGTWTPGSSPCRTPGTRSGCRPPP